MTYVRSFFTHISQVLLLSLAATVASAGTMVRVVDVRDGRTLIVDSGGQRTELMLAGIHPYLTTRGTLVSAIAGRWITVEHEPSGGVYAWRSPDGVMLNELLIATGEAGAADGAYAYRAQFLRAQAQALLRASVVSPTSSAFQQSNVVVLGELAPDKGSRASKVAAPAPTPKPAAKPRRKK